MPVMFKIKYISLVSMDKDILPKTVIKVQTLTQKEIKKKKYSIHRTYM